MLAALTVAPVRSASADPPTLPRLYVHRSGEASDCPDAVALAEAVAQQMGHPALDTSPDPSIASIYDVEIFRGVDGYTAVVRASGRGAAGAREIVDNGANCTGLAAALPITLAILLDSESPRPPPAPVPRPAPATLVSAPEPMRRLGLSLGGAVTAGLVASLAPAVSAAVDVRASERVAVRLGGLWIPYSSVDVGPGDRGLEISLVLARPGVCWFFLRPADGALTAFGCADLAVGAIHAETRGVAVPGSTTESWFGAGASLGARLPLGPSLSLALEGSLLVPIAAKSFSIGHIDGKVFDAPPVGGSAGASLRLSIW